MPIELRVETDPEDPGQLALQLADALNQASTKQADADAFDAAANAEMAKTRSLVDLIFQLRERRRAGITSTSRMDPWASYDVEAMEAQLSEARSNAKEFRKQSTAYKAEAERCRSQARSLQTRLQVANREWSRRSS